MQPDDPLTSLARELARVGSRAVAAGLVVGSGGNLSARRPGGGDIVVTASGSWLDELGPDDFTVVDPGGRARRGDPPPTSELPLHLAAYSARPDITAVVHLHPQTSVLLEALGHPVRLFTMDHVAYVRRVRVVPPLPSGTSELARATAAAHADAECVVLARHGCSVVADSVGLAYKRAANLEEAARATWRALALGDTTTGPPPAGVVHRLGSGTDHDLPGGAPWPR